MSFPYERRGLRLDEIIPFVESYRFGASTPDFVVFHHTAVPFTSWAPIAGRDPAKAWDANERGLSEQQVYTKRLDQLDGIKRVYEVTNGWSAGPQAFIDERYVWLMTPLNREGVHAKWFNSFRDARGRKHWSIGIEMLGCFNRTRWHPHQALLAATFVGALQRRLQTFKIVNLYPSAETFPGCVGVDKDQRCAHPERLRWGGITSHRRANKPECPGDAISDDYIVETLQRLIGATAPVIPPAPAPDLPPPGRYRVTADVLNVRGQPMLRQDNVVHQLAKGRVITVDVFKHDEGGDSTVWAHMAKDNIEGDKGFVSAKWLAKV